MTGRGEKGDAGEEGGWFVTVDGNAHVERHVRRRRRGGRGSGETRRQGCSGGRGDEQREPAGGRGVGACVWSGSSPGDAVLIVRASGLK